MALVERRTEHRVAILTLEDPPANAYTHEMMRALDEAILAVRFDTAVDVIVLTGGGGLAGAILAVRFDTAVDVIVLTGAGEKFFCAGANIGVLSKADPAWKYAFCLHANETDWKS